MGSEVAAVPMSPVPSAPFTLQTDERWTFLARAIAETGGDCATVRARATPRSAPIVCRETGCQWAGDTAPPTVRCIGDTATLLERTGPVERDCSSAFEHCDPASPTGCTDRALQSCPVGALARCDGDVQLSCDEGFVSFADCSRHHGGRCRESGVGANCEYPSGTACVPADARCDGSLMTLCIQGSPIRLDCEELGFAGCVANSEGPHCEPKS